MEHSASRFSRITPGEAPMYQTTFDFADISPRLQVLPSHGAAQINIKPLLVLQRLSLESKAAVCVANDFQAAQRYFVESISNGVTGCVRPLLVHEMMPAHQQDYLIDCLQSSQDFAVACAPVVFTTLGFYAELMGRVEWLGNAAEIVWADGDEVDNDAREGAEQRLHSIPIFQAKSAEPAVSCICVRRGAGGKWVLTDHEVAVRVRHDEAPAPELVPRLLRHTVEISGHRLAPYLAMMFDVPDAWKVYPELVTRSLLVFDKDVCALGCSEPGVPSRIIWSDVLGIVY